MELVITTIYHSLVTLAAGYSILAGEGKTEDANAHVLLVDF